MTTVAKLGEYTESHPYSDVLRWYQSQNRLDGFRFLHLNINARKTT